MATLHSITSELLAEKDLDRATATQYARTQSRFDRFLGRIATAEDLNTRNANEFLVWVKDAFHLTNTSVRNHRRALVRIWNYAVELGIAQPFSTKRLRQPKPDASAVSAWSMQQFSLLLQAAESIEGQLKSGVPASSFLVAWLWVGYETGFRPSDMRALAWENVDLDGGTISVLQNKTKRPHTSMIGPKSVSALKKLKSCGQKKVFCLGKAGVRRWELMLFKEAEKLGFRRNYRQALGTLRKTHATEVYRQHGLSTAAESLGHVGGTRTAADHYIDRRYINRGTLPPSPPINPQAEAILRT